ncbi:LOW QUALITY PROTEIN: probable glutamate receptor [Panulirus ornatus]|uniref:LOW QUALITY PROTEIN: probable glutamate receptor n=1 Tax=Panulirus ornatus TaxID=150431 RepID=UPI003A85429E
MTTTNVMALLLALTVVVLRAVGQLPRPKGKGKTLGLAGGALAEVLARERPPHCSVILLTDGTTSPTTVFTELSRLRAPWGAAVFEVEAEVDLRVMRAELTKVTVQARQLRQVSWCVSLVVVSDDPAFLATSAEVFYRERLLLWSNRHLAVTRRPLRDLDDLRALSMMNSALLIVSAEARSTSCSVFVHLPYTSQVVRVASWTPRQGLSFTSEVPLFPDKFYRFLVSPRLRVTAEEFPPHVVITKEWTQGRQWRFKYSGSMRQLLDVLAASLNFTYTLQRPPDGSFGNQQPDGSVSGMLGMVTRDEVDLGLGPFSITASRAEVVDYVTPIVSDNLRILGGRGKPEVDPWSFVMPLAPLVWAAVLAALVVMLATAVLLSSWFFKTPPSISVYLRVLLQENTLVVGERWWERFMALSWVLMIMVLTQSYSSNLMSLLAVRHIPQPYQSLRDVIDDSSVTMIWELGTAYVQHFRNSKSGIFSEVHVAEQEGRVMYVLASDYVRVQDELVREGEHVFIGEDLTSRVLMAHDFSNTGQCDFYTSREAFLPFMYGMTGQKNSPLIPAISKRVTSLKEGGLYDHWMKNLNVNSTVCIRPATKITVKTSLSVTNLWGMFVALVTGNAAGLLVFGFELLSDCFSKTRITHL